MRFELKFGFFPITYHLYSELNDAHLLIGAHVQTVNSRFVQALESHGNSWKIKIQDLQIFLKLGLVLKGYEKKLDFVLVSFANK